MKRSDFLQKAFMTTAATAASPFLSVTAENKKQLWVPPGFAHGFLVLTSTAEILYKTTDYYHPQSEVCLAWNDPTVNIQWPLTSGVLPNLNAKDSAGLSWDKAPKF